MSFHNHDTEDYNKKYAKPSNDKMTIDDHAKRVRAIQIYLSAQHLSQEEFIKWIYEDFNVIKK